MTSWIFPATTGTEAEQVSPVDVLTVDLEMHDRTTVVTLSGPVCAYTAPHLDAELQRIEDVDRHCIVIDARAVHTMSTDGLEVLVDHAERCRRSGGSLVIRAASPVTRRVLAICHLQDLLEPTPTTVEG